MMVWDADRLKEPAEELVEFAREFTSSAEKLTLTVEEKWKYHRTKTMRLGVLTIESGVPKK